MKKLILTTVLGALLGFVFQAYQPKKSHEPDCGFVQNVYGERVAWKKLPVSLQISEKFPREKIKNVEEAIKHWEDAFGRKIFVVVNYEASGEAPQQDGANVIYWMREWDANKKSEQGRTPIYWLGNELKEADILINAKDYNFDNSVSNKPRVDLTSLLVHELGHVLGLKHKGRVMTAPELKLATSDASSLEPNPRANLQDALRAEENSVMYPYLSSNTVRVNIPDMDIRSLRCEYK